MGIYMIISSQCEGYMGPSGSLMVCSNWVH